MPTAVPYRACLTAETLIACKGTGLGLSISYRIIMEHRGTIAVRRNDTAGVTFLIRIPVDAEAPKTTTVEGT